jgi:hypothetical protein
MTNIQILDPEDLEEDIAMLEMVGAMEVANIKTEIDALNGDVKKVMEALDQLNLGDSSLYSLGAVQNARGTVLQAQYSIRDVYAPNDRFQRQRSRGG